MHTVWYPCRDSESLTRYNIDGREEAVDDLPVSQNEQAAMLAESVRTRVAWSGKKLTILLHGITDEDHELSRGSKQVLAQTLGSRFPRLRGSGRRC